jgi:hypothetical protein
MPPTIIPACKEFPGSLSADISKSMHRSISI